MNHRSVLLSIAAVTFAPWIAAQQADDVGGNVLGRGAPPLVPDSSPFDARDLSGVWLGDTYGFNARYEPPMTAEGKAKFDAQKPSYGALLGSAAAQDTSVPSGRRRAIPPAQGNDYVGGCNPLGLVRLLFYSPAPMEMVMTPNRVIQKFEWTWDHREIWLDGRLLPDVDAYLPRWNGYSVGRWDGNTLVVDTLGLDGRQWLDHFGYPLSEGARVEERWTRTHRNIMELQVKVTDPEIYEEPWTSDVATFRLVPPSDLAAGTGWASLVEDKCVPLDEVQEYNRRVRDPAGGVETDEGE